MIDKDLPATEFTIFGDSGTSETTSAVDTSDSTSIADASETTNASAVPAAPDAAVTSTAFGEFTTSVLTGGTSQNDLLAHLEQSCAHMWGLMGTRKPMIGIILGSGLGCLADEIEDPAFIPYGEVPFMKTSTTSSHVGRFVVGKLGGKEVIAMQGRLHGYEGYTAQEVAYPIWLMHDLGVTTLITTNAAGAINESYHVGDFCIIRDHINLTGRNPIAGTDPDGIAPRFFSMLNAYEPRLRVLAHETAEECGIAVQEGTYLGLLGPSFETPAEIQAFRTLGADTVAMSVCEEVIAARHVGMHVLGMSLVTNMACGIEGADPTDDEVLEVAVDRSDDFCRLITGIVTRLEI